MKDRGEAPSVATAHIVVTLTLVLAAGLPEIASAQWFLHAGASAAYDDNPLAVAESPGSSIWALELGLDRAIKSLGVGYTASYTRYDQLSSVDAIVGTGYFTFSNDTTTAGLVFEHRSSVEERLYDFVGFRALASHRFFFAGASSTIQINTNLYRFPILEERNRQSIGVVANVIRSFPTKTTLIGVVGVGYTTYTGDIIDDATPAVWHRSASMRVAQSLSPTTGLAVQALVRHLSGDTPSAYTVEEDGVSYALLDDPSLYDTRNFSVELTQMLLDYSLTLKVGAYHSYRDYLTQGRYVDGVTYLDSEARTDKLNAVWGSASYLLRSLGPDIEISLSAQWSDNTSNSFWYTYSGSYLSGGLQYNF